VLSLVTQKRLLCLNRKLTCYTRDTPDGVSTPPPKINFCVSRREIASDDCWKLILVVTIHRSQVKALKHFMKISVDLKTLKSIPAIELILHYCTEKYFIYIYIFILTKSKGVKFCPVRIHVYIYIFIFIYTYTCILSGQNGVKFCTCVYVYVYMYLYIRIHVFYLDKI
jgi:hypothetical protein